MTGAMYIAECLKLAGVEKVFGQCGHTNYALIDACQRLGIDNISFRHEQQAAHAADAYFRVSHKLAVLNVQLVAGHDQRHHRRDQRSGRLHADGHCRQHAVLPPRARAAPGHPLPDASQSDIYRPFCKRVWRVDDPEFLPDVLPRALNVAQTGRPGAVFIDVPMDVFSAAVPAAIDAVMNRMPTHQRTAGSPDGVTRAAAMLRAAKAPVIFAGNGVNLSEAWTELRALAELTSTPVTTTLTGKGVFPESHPLALVGSGHTRRERHGTKRRPDSGRRHGFW